MEKAAEGNCFPFKRDLNAWFASHGSRVPVKGLDKIIKSGKFHPTIEGSLKAGQAFPTAIPIKPGLQEERRLSRPASDRGSRGDGPAPARCLVKPTSSNPPRTIGDLNTPHGDNNLLFSPSTGFPAVTVPMGTPVAIGCRRVSSFSAGRGRRVSSSGSPMARTGHPPSSSAPDRAAA